jgi:hypothetical protein
MTTKFRKNGIAISATENADAWRPVNQEELNAWYTSDASKGMNCAGESKLPPLDTYFDVEGGTIVHILKARVKARQGYHFKRNCMEVMLPCGETVFASKMDFTPVS